MATIIYKDLATSTQERNRFEIPLLAAILGTKFPKEQSLVHKTANLCASQNSSLPDKYVKTVFSFAQRFRSGHLQAPKRDCQVFRCGYFEVFTSQPFLAKLWLQCCKAEINTLPYFDPGRSRSRSCSRKTSNLLYNF